MPPHDISLDDAMAALLRRPILVVGSAATSFTVGNDDLFAAISKAIALPDNSSALSLYELIDRIRATSPDDVEPARTAVHRYLASLQMTAQAEQLAGGKWSAVVSLTSDLLLEDALQQWYARQPSSWALTVVDHHSIVPPPQSTPCFKLLGNYRDSRPSHTLAIDTAEFLKRRHGWSRMLATLADYARNAPLVFIGTHTSAHLAREFLGALYSGAPPYPTRLIFLHGDDTFNDPTINALASDYSDIAVVKATVRNFCAAAAAAQVRTSTVGFVGGTGGPSNAASSFPFGQIVALVPATPSASKVDPTQQRRLVDGLFRPTTLDWAPFQYDLDLHRTAMNLLSAEILTKCGYLDKHPQAIVTIRGEAGVGKTTIMKRVAVDFATKGYRVLWCKRLSAAVQRKAYSDLAEWLRTNRPDKSGASSVALLFCDDPVSMHVDPHEILRAFESSGMPAILITSQRHSDILQSDATPIAGAGRSDSFVDVNHTFDGEEMAALPEFLVKLGVAKDVVDANSQIASIPNTHAGDVLCSLWYLLPETKGSFTASIHDEYARLGGATGVIRAMADAATDLSEHARHAYEYVAVTSHLNIGLPLEVLVTAIGISYEEWMQMCVGGRPVWGLLYDETDTETGNVVFVTRNHVVTKVLLELVNAGAGHAGEYRVLKKLVGSCDKPTIPYRAFLVDLLVKNRRKLENILSYEWGTELYELATRTFPSPDRTLEHHYGTWHRWAGKQPKVAYEQYQKALDTPNYPYSDRTERKENILTSMAAAVVEMVKKGQQRRENALELIESHLNEAGAGASVDPHCDHVFANALFQLGRLDGGKGDAVSLRSIAESLRVIERSLQLIGTVGRLRRDFAHDISALRELHTNVLGALTDIAEAESHAVDLFDKTKIQAGFEVVTRKYLEIAEKSTGGEAFRAAFEYVCRCETLITRAGEKISADLAATRIDVYVRWRLQVTRGPIDWQRLKDDLDIVLADRKYQHDLNKLYYFAITIFHLGDPIRAESTFRSMQRISPSNPVRFGKRNCYVGKEGQPKRLQCEVRVAHGRTYLYVVELSRELELYGTTRGLVPGATAHCYIVFSLVGPFAVLDKPDETEFLLP